MTFIHNLWQTLTTDWILLFWIPVGALIVHRGQRWKVGLFALLLAFVLRLQVDVMQSFGFAKGFTGFVDIGAAQRGVVIHSVFIALFILISYLSPQTKGPIYLAASLSLFFMSFFLSCFIMMI